jgi:hypothetical protein
VRPVAGLVLLVALLAVVGCGGTTGTLSGVVKVGETTLKGGTVTFWPAKGNSVQAPIGPDGRYKAEGVPVGESKVVVETNSVKRPPIPKAAEKSFKEQGKQYPTGERYVPIPTRYGDPNSTSLKVTVTGGEQPYDITMSFP